jgi:alcohol dehydrogenase class IV
VIHGFAAPLGGLFRAPHGAICARLLPFAMEANVRALQARAPGSPALERYGEIARIVTGRPDAGIADGVGWAKALGADLRVPPLSTYGPAPTDVPTLVAEAQRASSTKGNPIVLTAGELTEIVRQAL